MSAAFVPIPFTVVVEEYTDPIWIEADKAEIDFGSMRYNYVGTPTVAAQTVTISNIHTEQIRNLAATLDENSDFEITEDLSANLLYAKDLANSSGNRQGRAETRLVARQAYRYFEGVERRYLRVCFPFVHRYRTDHAASALIPILSNRNAQSHSTANQRTGG